MKRLTYRYIAFIVVSLLLLAGCGKELDTLPNSAILTPEQIADAMRRDDNTLSSMINGMYNALAQDLGTEDHSDFGYPSVAIRLDVLGDYFKGDAAGYDHFSSSLLYNYDASRGKRGWASYYVWRLMYKTIKVANDILGVTPLSDETKYVVGQAKALRAWSYFTLAQLFQFTYKGHENSLSVPLVTEKTDLSTVTNNPRIPVKDLYKFIMDELNSACTLLKGFTDPSRAKISECVVYGIRAKVNMVLNQWSAAAQDAKKSIALATESGISPFGIADCSIPNFDKLATCRNAMWGLVYTSESYVTKTGIANYTSMICALNRGAMGYCSAVGCYRYIPPRLYESIPDPDVRKLWWAYAPSKMVWDAELKDSIAVHLSTPQIMINAGYSEDFIKYTWYVKNPDYGNLLYDYACLKFAPTDKNVYSQINSNDFFIMRIEEMHYILAEALGRSNESEGVAYLTNFVKSYRNPSYDFTKTGRSFLDEILWQKKIEFFGEGIAWFDIMRMNKGVNRVDVVHKDPNGYPLGAMFNIAPNSAILLYQIPLREQQNNKAIVFNPSAESPKDQIK